MNAPWLDVARKEIGVREIPGTGANLRILAYHACTSLQASSDEVPWCSSFANWCFKQAGIVGTGSAAAASWLHWGSPAQPELGAVTVLHSASGHHVGFFLSQDETHVRLLGGNQGDQVKESAFPLAHYRVVALRWPSA